MGKKGENGFNLDFVKNKKAIELQMLAYWLIGLAILVIAVFAIIILKGKGASALDYISNLLRFGK